MKEKITVWHKPTCSKCIDATAFLQEHGIIPDEWRAYLEDVPSEEELTAVIKMLGIPAKELVRTKEGVFAEQYEGRSLSEAEWITAMHEHPELIQRPIIIIGNKAYIGRSRDGLSGMLER
jgi:arsenate reductase